MCILGAGAAYGLIYNARVVRLKEKTRTKSIKDVRRGDAAVKGRVVATGKTLQAPLSDKPCVYYDLVVEEESVTGNAGTIIKDQRFAPWVLSDDSGLARVDLSSATLRLSSTYRESTKHIFGSSPDKAHVDEVLKRYGKTSHRWIFEKGLDFKETILQEGVELYVLGPVRFDRSQESQRSGLPTVYFSRKRGPFKGPFIVSDESGRQTLTNHQRQLIGFAVVLLVAAIGAAVVYDFLTWANT